MLRVCDFLFPNPPHFYLLLSCLKMAVILIRGVWLTSDNRFRLQKHWLQVLPILARKCRERNREEAIRIYQGNGG